MTASTTPPTFVLTSRPFTTTCRTSRSIIDKVFAALIFALLIAIAGAVRVDAGCTPDAQGPDDEVNQKDISQFCTNGTCDVSGVSFSIAFDDRFWSGANTGDGCLLFDTDDDGKANNAICGSLTGAGVLGGVACYTCDDTRPDHCGNAVAHTCTSDCTVAVTDDPFVGEATHAQANDCNGTQCLADDSSITCCTTEADRGVGGDLLDACTYSSSSTNSDASDCIVTRECGNNANDPVCIDTNPCTVDSCNTVEGVCQHVPGNAGATCRTGAGVCDVAETCTGSSSECPADGFAQSGECSPANGPCDVAESCDGSGVDCPADDVAEGGVCRPAADQCDVPESCNGVDKTCPTDGFQPNNTGCSDGNACSTGDVCVGGACTPSGTLNCDDDKPCTSDGCDPSSGCTNIDNNESCDDGSECTTNDTCSGGSCVGGAAPDCEDNNVCTTDACDPNVTDGCTHTNNTISCDDGSDCTTNDACSAGSCHGGSPPDCDDGIFCTTDSCPGTDGCHHDPVGGNCCDSNADCGPDDDECTINERCEQHQCVSTDRTCNDDVFCTDDSCNPATPGGCVYVNNAKECDDGSACTTGDACHDGDCVGGSAPDCEDNNVCTTEGCDPNVTGGCTHTNNTNECDDKSACTTGDTCSGGDCFGGAPPNCDDGKACTDDQCVPDVPGGCTHTNDDTNSCTDDDGCTVDDACVGGTCQPGAQKVCDDAKPCTTDTCSSPAGTCVFTNNSNQCNDGDVCTLNDICFGGDCVAGPRDLCNDHLDCTDDLCVSPATGCTNEPVEEPCCETNADCLDQTGCTVGEACVNKSCVSTPRDCADEDPCTLDSCTSMSAQDFLCVNANCAEIQGQPCPPEHPECIPPECGNEEVEAGETCDPPGSTTTPNGNVCRANCTYCGDTVVNDASETCDDGNPVTGCSLIHPQQAADECQNDCTVAVCKDPARITLTDWIDRYDVHGLLPAGKLVDFSSKALVVELRNPRGRVLYRGSLEAGSLVGTPTGTRFTYKNKGARASGGLAMVRISRHRYGYRLTARTYGNLYNAGSDMVTKIYSGSDQWNVHGSWKQTRTGWRFDK